VFVPVLGQLHSRVGGFGVDHLADAVRPVEVSSHVAATLVQSDPSVGRLGPGRKRVAAGPPVGSPTHKREPSGGRWR